MTCRTEKMIEEFQEAIQLAHPVKAGMQLLVESVQVENRGAEAGVLVVVKLPDGTTCDLVLEGLFYQEGDETDPLEMVARLSSYTDLSPAGIRRRLRRIGLLPALLHTPSEED